jgi:hypothetical protein
VIERRGHIKISRKFFEDDAMWREPRRFSRAEAWIDCLQMAAWKPRRYAVGLDVEHLERGEFVVSVRYLAQRWQWSKSAIQRWFVAVQKAGRLAVQRQGQIGTVYLLVNYEHYQGTDSGRRDTDRDGEWDTSGTPAGHLRDKTEAVKAGKARKESLSDEELFVLNHYRTLHPKRLRGGVPPKTLRLLRAALGSYPALDLCLAIDGNAASAFHRENNHMGLDLILRDANKIDYFMGLRETAAKEADTVEMTDDFGVMRMHRRNGNGKWEIVA